MAVPILAATVLPDGTSLRYIDIITRRVTYAINSMDPASKIIIIVAGTSSGKTLTVPTALYAIRPNIIVTVPTIILAKECAIGVCRCIKGFVLGDNVGISSSVFKTYAHAGVVFATDGTLLVYLSTLSDDDIMDKFGIIILDEFHKRSVTLDFIAYLLRAFVQRNYRNPRCPIVICMSATISTDRIMQYFAIPDSAVINLPTVPTFAKQLIYLDADSTNYLADIQKTIQHVSALPDVKNILVFLPTIRAIQRIADGCADLAHAVVVLTGQSSRQISLDLTGDKCLFLATPVAETGLTLHDLTHVIDCGMYLAVEYNPLHDYTVRCIKAASDASVVQRIGRTGRSCDGVVYLMYTQATADVLAKYSEPDITTADFSGVLLTMLMADIDTSFWTDMHSGIREYWRIYTRCFTLADIDMINNPSTDSLRCAIAKLYLTGMYSPYTGLTRLGALAATITGLNVHNIRMVFAAYYYKANMYDAVTIATAMELNIVAPKHKQHDDYIAVLFMFAAFMDCQTVAEYNACILHHKLNDIIVQTWIDLRDATLYSLVKCGFVLRRGPPLPTVRDQFPDEYAKDVRALHMSVYDAYKNNLMQNGVCLRTGAEIRYTGSTAIIPGTFYTTNKIMYKECGSPGHRYYKPTCAQIALVPADYRPDVTFCES